MESHPWPKCKHQMDEDRARLRGSGFGGYVSVKRTGMLRQVTQLSDARVMLARPGSA